MIEFVVYDMLDNKKKFFSIVTKIPLFILEMEISRDERMSATGWDTNSYYTIEGIIKVIEESLDDVKQYYINNKLDFEEDIQQEEIDLLLFMKELKEKYNEDKYRVICDFA